jgi:hypothetical protein
MRKLIGPLGLLAGSLFLISKTNNQGTSQIEGKKSRKSSNMDHHHREHL